MCSKSGIVAFFSEQLGRERLSQTGANCAPGVVRVRSVEIIRLNILVAQI